MFTLPAVVANIALKDATDAFEAHWGREQPNVRRVRRSSTLVQLLALTVLHLSR